LMLSGMLKLTLLLSGILRYSYGVADNRKSWNLTLLE